MKTSFAVAAMCAVLSLPASAAEHLELSAAVSASRALAPHLQKIRAATDVDLVMTDVGTGQAVLHVIDRKAAVALVSTTSLWDAVGAARVAAWAAGHRELGGAQALAIYPVNMGGDGTQPLAFVTNAAPSPQLAKVLAYLSSESGRRMLVQR